ncbi:MAG: T9SS type A sorting domain-containing protein [candidate division WOR-3 bacterium]
MTSSKVITFGVVVLLVTGIWAFADRNEPGNVRPDETPAFQPTGSSEAAVPRKVVTGTDARPELQPVPSEPTKGEPPQILWTNYEGSPHEPYEPKPLWGPDVLIWPDDIKSPTPPGSERMIAYDQTREGILFAAFVVPNGDTIRIYRSTDGGNNWSYFNGVQHPGYVLSSPELVVAEGDSSFVFLFLRTSAGNGDVYCVRYGLTSGAWVFPIKVDADTIVNVSACRDNGNPYYLYVTYEYHYGYMGVRLYRSTDYGKTWTAPVNFVDDTQRPPKPDVAVGYDNRVYVSYLDKRLASGDSAAFRVKRSTDRGNNWEQSRQVGTPIVRVFDGVIGARHTDQTIWLVHVRDMEPWNGKGLGVFYYYTTNDDTIWHYGGDDGIGHLDTDNDEQMPSIATHWATGSPTVCYAIVPSESLMFTWCSEDTNWTMPIKVNDYRHTGNFPPQAGWKNVGIGSSYSTVLYCGVGPDSLWFDDWSMTGVEEKPVAVKHLTGSVYPNPASRFAVISYTLPKSACSELVIFDVTGRQVEVLAQGNLNAGEYNAVWNCENVPAGVYLYRLSAGNSNHNGRIVVTH